MVGEWVVEATSGDGAWRCHRLDSPFRKAVLRELRQVAPDVAAERAYVLVQLQHPNVGSVLGLATDGARWFLVSETAPGTPLDAFLAESRERSLPLRVTLDVGAQLCDAVGAVHAAGVVHGDLRARSVVLGQDGRVRLTGFDLSGSVERDAQDPSFAPELASGGSPTVATDRYALGVLVYELLSGRTTPAVPLLQRMALSLDESFPPDVRRAVAAATHPDPAVRPPVAELRTVLAAARDTLSTSGDPRTRTSTTSVTSQTLVVRTAPGALPHRIGRYEIVRELGRGGAGVVYEATDSELKRRVAIKVLLSGTFARAREIQRFKFEAQAVARLDHPGIVSVLDIGSHVDGAWFAMEYVDGPSLMERIRTGGPLPWPDAVRIAAVVARALAHAHAAGVLHRDVKPHNVLLEGGREPKLADFGLALDEDSEATRLTGTGQLLGTPTYMAPEQATADQAAQGPHTDVYSLGVTLYETLTGRVPFEGAAPLQVIGRILRGASKGPREHLPSLPRSVDLACLKAMRLDPADRYVSAAAFADDLERCLRGEPLVAAEPTWAERARWWTRANALGLGTASMALGAALSTMAGGYGLLAYVSHREDVARERIAAEAWASARERAQVATTPVEAEAVFRAFTTRPEHAGTHALAEAWWERAESLSGDARTSALASAYAASEDPADQDESLRRLADAARATRRHDLLGRVVDTLERRASPSWEHPSVRRLRRDALSTHRRLADAVALDPAGETAGGRVLRALASVTRTSHAPGWVSAWPEGGLWWRAGDQMEVLAAEPRLTRTRTLPAPEVPMGPHAVAFPLPGAVGIAWGTADMRETRIARVDHAGMTIEGAADVSMHDAVFHDFDGDGRSELVMSAHRSLVWGRRDNGGAWTFEPASPKTDAANSEVTELARVSSSGGGLLALVNEWSAYDVRLLVPGPEGDLVTQSRRKLGSTVGLTTVVDDGGRAVYTCKVDTYANARVFPPDRPFGVEAGMWELRPDGSTFRAQRVSDGECGPPRAGDFDGDGLVDLAWSGPTGMTVAARRPDGGFDLVRVDGLSVDWVGDLDGDPAAEIVASDRVGGELVVLGAGKDTLEPTATASPQPAAPPGGDRVFRAAWDRAEDLAYVGQPTEAAQALRELADLRFGRPEAVDALHRAAALFAVGGDAEQAAALLGAAADAGSDRALHELVALRRSHRDLRGEREALTALAALGALGPDDAEALATLAPLDALPTYELTFDRPLDPRWVVLDPLAVHRDRTRSVLIASVDGTGEVARLPVDYDGGWLEVEVELDVERAEWGSAVGVGLVRRGSGDRPRGVVVNEGGGGELLNRSIACESSVMNRQNHGVPAEGRQRVVVSGWFQPDGHFVCDIAVKDGPGAGTAAHFEADVGADTAGGDWDLVIRGAGETGSWTQLALHRVTLRGVGPSSSEAAPSDAATAVADGDPYADLAGAPPLVRLAGAADRGDRRQVVDALAKLVGPDRERALVHLLHPRFAASALETRAALGADWFAAVALAWQTVLSTHPATESGVAEMLSGPLDGVEAAEPRDVAERDLLAVLLARRGSLAWRQARPDRARVSLERASALAADPRFAPIADLGWATAIVAARADLAELYAAAGDVDAAFSVLAEALASAPSPLLVADVVAVRRGLDVLHADPRWAPYAGGGLQP